MLERNRLFSRPRIGTTALRRVAKRHVQSAAVPHTVAKHCDAHRDLDGRLGQNTGVMPPADPRDLIAGSYEGGMGRVLLRRGLLREAHNKEF
jgi:hypothetical protein